MPTGEIIIGVKSDITPYVYGCLVDDIRNLLESNGVLADIYDSVTEDTIETRKGMVGKNENKSRGQTIQGDLILGDKVWFNDDLGCRLRICGFTREQVERLRNAKFVDITLTDFIDDNMPGVVVHIS